jgi:hypothetical protein
MTSPRPSARRAEKGTFEGPTPEDLNVFTAFSRSDLSGWTAVGDAVR